MISESCMIYVVNKRFIPVADVSPGDRVYSLDWNFKIEEVIVSSVNSEFANQTINVIDSGQHKMEATSNTRYLYHSPVKGSEFIKFEQIPSMTPDKDYQANKYLPVLSWPNLAGYRNCSDTDLEYCARMIAAGPDAFDKKSFLSITKRCTGEDAFALVDFLEFWCSSHPGLGWLDRVQVKSRAHIVPDKETMFELMRLACFAGYTCSFQENENSCIVNISYESMPVPGSRPKNEKYKRSYYIGNVYSVNAKNRPLLGTYKNKCYYIPCTTSDIM